MEELGKFRGRNLWKDLGNGKEFVKEKGNGIDWEKTRNVDGKDSRKYFMDETDENGIVQQPKTSLLESQKSREKIPSKSTKFDHN